MGRGHLAPLRALLRKVRVTVYADSGAASSLRVTAVLTTANGSPRALGDVYAPTDAAGFGWQVVSTSAEIKTFDLAPQVPVGFDFVREAYPCGASATSSGSAQSFLIPAMLWVGWRASHMFDVVGAISAFESREI